MFTTYLLSLGLLLLGSSCLSEGLRMSRLRFCAGVCSEEREESLLARRVKLLNHELDLVILWGASSFWF